MMFRRLHTYLLPICLIGLTSSAFADVPSALVREGDALGGAPVVSVRQSTVNHAGGYAFMINTEDATTTLSHVFGNASGAAGSVLRTEATIGDYEQTSFESFFGLSDAGAIAYSPSTVQLSTGITGLDAVWVDDTPVLTEEDPIVATNGSFSSFNSRPGITADGTPYWVGGATDIQGNGSIDRGLFYGSPSNILIQGGDNVGVAETVTVGSGIDFDFRFSKFGTNLIAPIDVASPSTNDLVITVNGTAISPGGNVMREGTLMPASVGGNGTENWDNFDFVAINEAGDYFVTGDTDNADTSMDEFVFANGSAVLREGDMVGGFTLDGSIEGGDMNEQGDWAVIWDVAETAGTSEALILNGELLLKEGDAIDWDGDGVIDPNATIDAFIGISSLSLADQDSNGNVAVYFTADVSVDGEVLAGGFCYCAPVPEPSSCALLLWLPLTFLLRRRR